MILNLVGYSKLLFIYYYYISMVSCVFNFFFCKWFLTIKAATIAPPPNATLTIANSCPPSITPKPVTPYVPPIRPKVTFFIRLI